MIMADVFKILFPVIGTLMSFVCFWLLLEAILPAVVDRSREKYERHPLRAALIGLLVTVPAILFGLALLNGGNPVAAFVGLSVLSLLVLLGLVGSAGLTRHVGQRLHTPFDEKQPWRGMLRGGTVLSISFLFPFVGWFLVLPMAMVSGVGAAVLSIRKPKETKDGQAVDGAGGAVPA